MTSAAPPLQQLLSLLALFCLLKKIQTRKFGSAGERHVSTDDGDEEKQRHFNFKQHYIEKSQPCHAVVEYPVIKEQFDEPPQYFPLRSTPL